MAYGLLKEVVDDIEEGRNVSVEGRRTKAQNNYLSKNKEHELLHVTIFKKQSLNYFLESFNYNSNMETELL